MRQNDFFLVERNVLFSFQISKIALEKLSFHFYDLGRTFLAVGEGKGSGVLERGAEKF